MQIIEAEVIDTNHLKLLNPIEILPGSKIRITVASHKDTDKNETLEKGYQAMMADTKQEKEAEEWISAENGECLPSDDEDWGYCFDND